MLRSCVICHRPGHFQISHFPDGEHASSTAPLCSLACLAVWAWRYGAQLSRQAVQKLLGGKAP
jgi:hypothetical protein